MIYLWFYLGVGIGFFMGGMTMAPPEKEDMFGRDTILALILSTILWPIFILYSIFIERE